MPRNPLLALPLAAVLVAGCGRSSSEPCDPACRAGFECYYGICLPSGFDAGTDGDTVHPDDAADRPETPDDAPYDTGCADPAICDDGDPCTLDLCEPAGGCSHPPVPDGTGCPDDGDPCSQDVCMAGACVHPAAEECCLAPEECDDGDPCTTDDCGPDHLCRNEPIPDCCARDADCLWEGHLWECDPESHVCYDPPGGEFCASCMTRRDCGDGGESSDDWCVRYAWNDAGCTKDCRDDADCPGASYCRSLERESACTAADAACICVSRFGSCAAYNTYGAPCLVDASCRSCDACDDLVCRGSACTWPCEGPEECPLGAVCADGVCAPG